MKERVYEYDQVRNFDSHFLGLLEELVMSKKTSPSKHSISINSISP